MACMYNQTPAPVEASGRRPCGCVLWPEAST